MLTFSFSISLRLVLPAMIDGRVYIDMDARLPLILSVASVLSELNELFRTCVLLFVD